MNPVTLVWTGLGLALVYLPMADGAPSWVRSVVKTLPLLFFAAAAHLAHAPSLLPVALVFSALGDFALSRQGERAFLYGLAAFALAHIVYIPLFLLTAPAAPWASFQTQPLIALALIALGVSTEQWLAPHAGRLVWPVRAYVLLIILMGLAALAHPMGALPAGALLFILSDLILAVELFRMADDDPRAPFARWMVWVFYIAGQALILSVAAAPLP